MLLPELLPEGGEFVSLLIPIQEDDTGRSHFLLRLETDLGRVQLTLGRRPCSVVWVPVPDLVEGVGRDDYGPLMFRTLFRDGADLASIGASAGQEICEELWLYERNETPYNGPSAQAEGWREWTTWVTDGRAVAAHLVTVERDPATPFRTDIPWF